MHAAHVPAEVVQIGESLLRFVDQEVVPLETANKALLATDRTIFDEKGQFTPEVQALRRTVRMRSAEQGFYTMFGPAEIGGAGLGPSRPFISTPCCPSIAARAAFSFIPS